MELDQQRATAPVAVLRTHPSRDQVFKDTQRVMELAGWRNFITAGADVALKPNLGWDKLIPGSISGPWVVEAVILAIREHVGRIFLVESDQVASNVETCFRITGMDDVCRRQNIEWVNMTLGTTARVQGSGRKILRDVNIPEILQRTELITLPVLKTHNKTIVTGALKNQWGCLETLRHNFHLVLDDAIADVNSIVQPRFAVMDGTVGLEGDGPKSGIPKEMNTLLASGNLVGIDAVAARLMGFDPSSINHLHRSAAVGMGSIPDPDAVLGDSVDEIAEPFIPAANNPVSWFELALRRSTVRKLAFHTPLFGFFCWGARRYYDVWDLLVGRARRRRFMASSGYAAQWQD